MKGLKLLYNPLVKKGNGFLFPVVMLSFLISMAFFAPIVANDKPLVVVSHGKWSFPVFQQNFSKTDLMKIKKTDFVLFPPVVYACGKKDMANSYKSPFDLQYNGNKINSVLPVVAWHWLGTNKRGEDVLSGIIHGARVSLLIGILSMLIAGIIGLSLGAVSGYFGDHSLRISRGSGIFLIPGILAGFFYAFQLRGFILTDAFQNSFLIFLFQSLISVAIFFFFIMLSYFIGKLTNPISFMRKKVFVPVDTVISKITELFVSLPLLIIIVVIASITGPSVENLILIFGFTMWAGIARIVRAEIMKIKKTNYIEAAKASGLRSLQIILRHAIPNAAMPAIVSFTFGIATVILAESGLSFLGIGVPPESVTWGSLISDGRENFDAWWLIVFPGIALFLTILSFNLLGDRVREANNSKEK